jgi:hypothetical protein
MTKAEHMLRAREARVEQFASISYSLRTSYDLPKIQNLDVANAYLKAISLESIFRTYVSQTAQNLGVMQWKCRPGSGIKDAHRVLEKASHGHVPLDLLGGKFVLGDMKSVYSVADKITNFFQIAFFKDRFLQPQNSGYRDLQFGVVLDDNHIAELKICHTKIDELDDVEHKIYEIIRALSLKNLHANLSRSEARVYAELENASKALYDEVWQDICDSEIL